MSALSVGDTVTDRWYRWRVGVVRLASRNHVKVEWSTGEVWHYDCAHIQFLEKVK